ncbi:putative Xenobiotic-transporting ATPase [Burkholderiales bacterium]|nr:putative Xenobiotic-transporting ATPase [Burkholderiales bacterium]
MLPFVRPYWRQVLLALVFLVLAAGATLGLPAAVRLLVDRGLMQPAAVDLGARMLAVNGYFLDLFAVAVALAVFTAARFYTVSWIGERVTADLRLAVYAHVLRQSPEFFESLKTGEILSRLTTDTTVIQNAVGSSISMGLRSAVIGIGAIVLLIASSPRLMLTVVGIIALVVLPALWIGRRVRRLSRASQDRIADTSGIAGEVLNAVSVVQSYTQETAEARRFSIANETAFATSIRRVGTRAAFTAFLIVGVFGSLLYGLHGGVESVLAGRISAGELSQTSLYIMLVASSVAVLAEVWGELLRAAGATERLMELLAVTSPIADPPQPQALGLRPAAAAGAGSGGGRTGHRGGIRGRRLPLPVAADASRVARLDLVHRARADGRPGRAIRCRQDHDLSVAAAFLRYRGRATPSRRRPGAGTAAGRAAREHRRGSAGAGDILRQRAREHPLWPR